MLEVSSCMKIKYVQCCHDAIDRCDIKGCSIRSASSDRNYRGQFKGNYAGDCNYLCGCCCLSAQIQFCCKLNWWKWEHPVKKPHEFFLEVILVILPLISLECPALFWLCRNDCDFHYERVLQLQISHQMSRGFLWQEGFIKTRTMGLTSALELQG